MGPCFAGLHAPGHARQLLAAAVAQRKRARRSTPPGQGVWWCQHAPTLSSGEHLVMSENMRFEVMTGENSLKSSLHVHWSILTYVLLHGVSQPYKLAHADIMHPRLRTCLTC